MPAKSKAQRRLFALALQYKRGELSKSEVSDEVIELSELPEKTLEDYAKTSEKDLPDHVEETTAIGVGGLPFGHEIVSTRRQADMQLHFNKKDKAEAEAENGKNDNKPKTKPASMLLSFEDWKNKATSLQEFEAPAASTTNTPGMGNVTPPSYNSTGSGDTFGSLVMNQSDWKRWNKMRKKNQKGPKEKSKVETQRPAWELGGRLPVPVANTAKT
jgi:hypothetical protein